MAKHVVLYLENRTELAVLTQAPRNVAVDGVTVLGHGSVLDCVLALCEHLTVKQLHVLRMDHLPPIIRRVARREDAAALAAVRDRLDGPARERDEDGDEVQDPTPLEVVAGQTEAPHWREDGSGPVS